MFRQECAEIDPDQCIWSRTLEQWALRLASHRSTRLMRHRAMHNNEDTTVAKRLGITVTVLIGVMVTLIVLSLVLGQAFH